MSINITTSLHNVTKVNAVQYKHERGDGTSYYLIKVKIDLADGQDVNLDLFTANDASALIEVAQTIKVR